MRGIPAVIASVAVHAAALAWFLRGEAAVPPPVPAPEPEPPPIEIAFLDEPAPPPVETALPPAPPPPAPPPELGGPDTHGLSPRGPAESIALSTHSGSETGATGRQPGEPDGAAGPGRSGLMTMRRPRLEGGLSGSFLDDFISRSKPAEPVPDLPGARIDAEIADIRARLRRTDRPGRDHGADYERLVQLSEERKRVELKPDGDGTYKADSPGFTAKIDRDGKAHLEDKPPVQVQGGTIRFDVTDMAMRAAGIDPYAAEKMRFLERTRDQRAAIRREHEREQLSKSALHMRRNLERLWASTTDLAARKQHLFELWDECAETGDAQLVAGGADARQVVAEFIQIKLTGEHAYTAGELAQLNRQRRSKQVFAPYDASATRRAELSQAPAPPAPEPEPAHEPRQR
jgi:hypothetical protein